MRVFHVDSDGNRPTTTQVPVKVLAMFSSPLQHLILHDQTIVSWSCVWGSVRPPTSPTVTSKDKEEGNEFCKQSRMYQAHKCEEGLNGI